jgi:hypothetical protein
MNGDENQHPVSGQPDSNWGYRTEGPSGPNPSEQQALPPVESSETEVTWTASEFIARHKGGGWYLLLAVGTVLVAALVYLISRDLITVGAIVAAVVLFGVSASRKPRVLTYHMNESGLTIGTKFYPYSLFKSFSIAEEGAFSSIVLTPLKRFMPFISIYYEPADEDRIVAIFAHYLPMENQPADAVDSLMRHIRF